MPLAEDTPLLESQRQDLADGSTVYARFSPAKKQSILAMVSACGLIPLFVSGTFTPSIPQIAKDMDSTGAVINLAASITAFGASLGGLIGASYSTYYGRRPVYLFSLPLLIVGSIGVAASTNVASLLFWRFFQALGPSPGLVVGAGVIGDIYRLEERGRAMGIFFAACLIGPAVAPLAGGLGAHLYSWRVAQGSLGVLGFFVLTILYLFLPETSQPGARVVDKIKRENNSDKRVGFVFINPLRPMWLLRSPNLFLTSIILSASLMTVFVLLIPLSYTIGIRYQISNEALIGACFLPAGIGNMVGATIVGRLSDYTVTKWLRKRGGVWYPEDRLRSALIPFVVLIPIPMLAFGLVNKFVDGRLGLILSLICLFCHGVGVEMAFGPCAAYLVDVMHSRSAESLAANNGLRSMLMAISIALALPMIDKYGITATNTLCAGVVWSAAGILWCIIQYGSQMRGWVDIGYSTAENN